VSNSLSLLNELKDIAKEAAEREKIQPVSQQIDDNPAPKPRGSSSSFSLSDALADVHKLVDEEARAEQKMRSKTRELAQAALEAEQAAEEHERQQEMAARLAAEEGRRQSLAEERRLLKLREDYEAALARGEKVELPLELRPPEPTPPPQAIQAPEPVQQKHIEEAVKGNQKPFIIGGVAAFVAIIAVLYVFVLSGPTPVPKIEKKVEMISFEKKQAEIEERKRIEKERIEAEAFAKIAAAKVEAEKKAAEETKRKTKSRSKRRAKKKRKAKKKNSFGVSLEGF
jgi:hypothetical protein